MDHKVTLSSSLEEDTEEAILKNKINVFMQNNA